MNELATREVQTESSRGAEQHPERKDSRNHQLAV